MLPHLALLRGPIAKALSIPLVYVHSLIAMPRSPGIVVQIAHHLRLDLQEMVPRRHVLAGTGVQHICPTSLSGPAPAGPRLFNAYNGGGAMPAVFIIILPACCLQRPMQAVPVARAGLLAFIVTPLLACCLQGPLQAAQSPHWPACPCISSSRQSA